MKRGQNKRGLTFKKWLGKARRVPEGFERWRDARPYWHDGADVDEVIDIFVAEHGGVLALPGLPHNWNEHMDRVQPIIRAQGNRGTV